MKIYLHFISTRIGILSTAICMFVWMPSQKKESGYPIVSDFASPAELMLVSPLSRHPEFPTEPGNRTKIPAS